MLVAIHQPQYLPWLGYFDKIRRADVFCFLDNVQYKKNEWQNRNKIKNVQGWQWLTVPVNYRFPQKIKEVTAGDPLKWGKKHLQALITNYSKAPFFKEYIGYFERFYSRERKLLSEINIDAVKIICELLQIKNTSFVIASDVSNSEDPTGRLVGICKAVGGDTYLSGKDGAGYMDLAKFRENNVSVIFQDFKHPSYPQQFGAFEPNLSVVDLLFNCGPESLDRILRMNSA